MPAVGLLLILAGAFIADSAIRNRSPLAVLVSVVQDPSHAQAVLRARGSSAAGSSGGGGAVDHDHGGALPGVTGTAPLTPHSGAVTGGGYLAPLPVPSTTPTYL